MRTLGMLALAAGALMTSTAEAGTIMISYPAVDYYYIHYTASAGESNRVTATYVQPTRTFIIRDTGAKAMSADSSDQFPLAKRWCVFVGQVASCVLPQETYGIGAYLDLGDGDDTSSTTSPNTSVSGGPGADRLSGGRSGDVDLYGDAGDDLLVGGPGDDWLDGGAGTDHLDGGAGSDRVHWFDPAPAGVHVSFDGIANDGHDQGAEGDNVLNVEKVWGTEHADVITGGAGDDDLRGNGGDDRITGGPGSDLVIGDFGNDHLDLRDGEADAYLCNEGVDVALADPFDEPFWSSPACETVTVEG